MQNSYSKISKKVNSGNILWQYTCHWPFG